LLTASVRRIGRGALTAALVYAAMIFPASGLFYVYFFQFSFVQDHYQYFACVGPAALSAALTWRFLPWSAQRTVFSGVLLLALCTLSWKRAAYFHTSETLWSEAIARNPSAWIGHYNLGVARDKAGLPAEALPFYAAALRANPRFWRGHYNMARALQLLGRDDEAQHEYEEALRLRPDDPAAHTNLGFILQQRGRSDEALAHYDAAIAADPSFAAAHLNRANLSMSRNRLEEALAGYDTVIRLAPTHAEAHLYRGMTLTAMGRSREAVDAYRAAMRLQEDLLPARERLAAELYRLGDLDGARRELFYYPGRGGQPRPALVDALTQH
jgi:tetratricopeptide (TPR) repeat protein